MKHVLFMMLFCNLACASVPKERVIWQRPHPSPTPKTFTVITRPRPSPQPRIVINYNENNCSGVAK